MALIQQHTRPFDPANTDDASSCAHHYAMSDAHHVEAIATYRWLASARADARPTIVHNHRFGTGCNTGCVIVSHTATVPEYITPDELERLQAAHLPLHLEFSSAGILLHAVEQNLPAFENLATLRGKA